MILTEEHVLTSSYDKAPAPEPRTSFPLVYSFVGDQHSFRMLRSVTIQNTNTTSDLLESSVFYAVFKPDHSYIVHFHLYTSICWIIQWIAAAKGNILHLKINDSAIKGLFYSAILRDINLKNNMCQVNMKFRIEGILNCIRVLRQKNTCSKIHDSIIPYKLDSFECIHVAQEYNMSFDHPVSTSLVHHQTLLIFKTSLIKPSADLINFRLIIIKTWWKSISSIPQTAE